MNKKKVLIAALAVCLIAIISFSSLAWFNDTDSVKNDFKFDDTDQDGQPDFKVDIYETENGQPVDSKEYLDILPGAVLAKDPTVKNTGDYSMYTRVVVTLSDSAAWVGASSKYDLTGEKDDLCILEEMVEIDANWVRFDNPVRDLDGDTITYVYYYNGVVASGAVTTPLFASVTIPTELQQEDMQYGDDMFSITVKADAIQAENIIPEGTEINGNAAYTAFALVNWGATSEYPEP